MGALEYLDADFESRGQTTLQCCHAMKGFRNANSRLQRDCCAVACGARERVGKGLNAGVCLQLDADREADEGAGAAVQ